MSTDYRFTIKRKADNKKLGTFYYNKIKSFYDIDASGFKLDPENISSNNASPSVFSFDDINYDIDKVKSKISADYSKMFEKKLLIPQAASRDIKDDIESDIYMLEDDVKQLMYVLEALAGLAGAVSAVVEDLVKDENGDDSDMAYVYNAAGLPKTAEGYEPHIWTTDVYIEALACI